MIAELEPFRAALNVEAADELSFNQQRAFAHHLAFLDSPRSADIVEGTYDNPLHPLHGKPLGRRETGLLEVHCGHGCGHPIPESVEWLDAFGAKGARGSWGVHGCDGCCGGGKARWEAA